MFLSLLLAMLAAVPPNELPLSRFESVSEKPDKDPVEHTDQIAADSDKLGRMTVPVTLGEKGPFRFMVDTGSERTVVSNEIADRLGLVGGTRVIVHGAAGMAPAMAANLPELRLSRKSVSGIEAPILRRSHLGADGILGIDSLRAQRVLFDFRDQELRIVSNSAPTTRDEDGAIVIRASRRAGRLVITNARMAGGRVEVLVDTGSQYTVGNSALKTVLEKRGLVELAGTVELISVTGDVLVGQLGMVKRMSIGNVDVEDIAMVFVDAHTFRELDMDDKPAMLLGMNVLRGFDLVSIDFASRKLRFVLPDGSGVRRYG